MIVLELMVAAFFIAQVRSQEPVPRWMATIHVIGAGLSCLFIGSSLFLRQPGALTAISRSLTAFIIAALIVVIVGLGVAVLKGLAASRSGGLITHEIFPSLSVAAESLFLLIAALVWRGAHQSKLQRVTRD